MIDERWVRLALSLAIVIPALPAVGQSEIQIDGVPVLTAGQSCLPNEALVGFATDGSLICSCFAGLSSCTLGCFNLLTDVNNCGACDNVCGTSDQECIEGYCRECDPITQNCEDAPSDRACYGLVRTGGLDESVCAQPAPENGSGMQGDDCSFINGCAEGYGCLLPSLPAPQLECARFCDADDKGGSNGTPRCVAELGVDFQCLSLSEVHIGIPDSFFGICADVS
jgi:hypothetical protein